jgi:hypothetical protein
MNTERLKEIIENCDYETRSYSGRGMSGSTCVGYLVANGEDMYSVACIVGSVDDADERQELIEIFDHVRSDNMGRDDMIIYFPTVRD